MGDDVIYLTPQTAAQLKDMILRDAAGHFDNQQPYPFEV